MKIDAFSGIRPMASDVRLAVAEAVQASDVDLRRGIIRPRARQTVWDSSVDACIPMANAVTPETIFRFRKRSGTDYWMYWTTDVDVAPGPVDSTDQRHYYTGDGAPKMFTADSVDDTTPPYPEAADSKYPYTWYTLGVPAPAAAPVINEASLIVPSEGSTGLITSVVVPNLIVYVNAAVESSSGYENTSAGRESLYAGLGTTNIRTFSAGAVDITCLGVGTRFRVSSIVDTDHVDVVAAGRGDGVPAEDLGSAVTDPWRWDNGLADTHRDAPLTRPGGGNLRRSFFMLPATVRLLIDNHTLREGDVIRITGAATPMLWNSTTSLVTSPVPTNRWDAGNVGHRTATKPDTSSITFSGSVGFMIERDGVEIDPAVPPTAAYDISTRAYVYTYVSALGEESAPSPASPVYTVRDGDPVAITTFSAPPTARRNIDRIWVYRTNTGSDTTAFQYVGEVLVSAIGSGFTDSVPDDELDETLDTDGWDVPRSDMKGIVALPNGMMAGFVGNRLCLSVPGFPHAWPREYEVLVDFDIVGLEVFGNSICITTEGMPYIATGTHPAQMSLRRIETLQACLDKRSLVSTGQRIVYCSREGLIASDDNFTNITAAHYTKAQWASIVGPDNAASRSLRAWYCDNQYILYAYYNDGTNSVYNQLVFDFSGGGLRITTVASPSTIQAAFSDPRTAELYYVVAAASQPTTVGTLPANNRQLLRWDHTHPNVNAATGYTQGDWKSRVFTLAKPAAFSCARVLCRRVALPNGTYNAYARVTLTVNGRRYDVWNSATGGSEDDVTLINAQAVISGQPTVSAWAGEQRSAPFRIVPNVLVDAVQVALHVEGPVEVEAVYLGETVHELYDT